MKKYFLGCDVSKGYADFIILDAQKRIFEPNFQLDDTFDGHAELYRLLERFFHQHPTVTLYAAVESTGGYEDNWFHALNKFQQHFNLKVTRLNPKGVTHNSAASRKRVITDNISARNIAEYLIVHPERITFESDDYFGPLRRKWQFVKSLTKQKTRLLNQLEKLLYIANPEILVWCRDGVSQWVLRLLELCPTAHQLAHTPVQKIAEIPYISEHRARELVDRAQKTVASTQDALTEDSIITIAGEILHLNKLLKKQTALIEQQQQLPEVELLRSFGSIGTVSALGLLIEMGPLERFVNVKKFAAFWGLHPKFKSSGDGISGVRMSKEGRKEPRAILYMVAMNAIIHNPLIREIFVRNLKKGKTKMDAIGVCMHKIARVIYGMLKNNQPFDPNIDRKNQMKSQQKKISVNNNRNRRFQKPDDKAPISRRKNQKRKEQNRSHNEHVIKHEITAPALSQ